VSRGFSKERGGDGRMSCLALKGGRSSLQQVDVEVAAIPTGKAYSRWRRDGEFSVEKKRVFLSGEKHRIERFLGEWVSFAILTDAIARLRAHKQRGYKKKLGEEKTSREINVGLC